MNPAPFVPLAMNKRGKEMSASQSVLARREKLTYAKKCAIAAPLQRARGLSEARERKLRCVFDEFGSNSRLPIWHFGSFISGDLRHLRIP